MALPEEELNRINKCLNMFCQSKSGDSVKLEYHIRGNRVTLVESRPLFIDPNILNRVNVAQFECSPDSGIWTLYWYDRKNRRQAYPTGRNRDSLEKLIAEVSSDPTGIFWD